MKKNRRFDLVAPILCALVVTAVVARYQRSLDQQATGHAAAVREVVHEVSTHLRRICQRAANIDDVVVALSRNASKRDRPWRTPDDRAFMVHSFIHGTDKLITECLAAWIGPLPAIRRRSDHFQRTNAVHERIVRDPDPDRLTDWSADVFLQMCVDFADQLQSAMQEVPAFPSEIFIR